MRTENTKPSVQTGQKKAAKKGTEKKNKLPKKTKGNKAAAKQGKSTTEAVDKETEEVEGDNVDDVIYENVMSDAEYMGVNESLGIIYTLIVG